MRRIVSILCLPLAVALTGCGDPDGGYYDVKGRWVPRDSAYNTVHPAAPETEAYSTSRVEYDGDQPVARTTTVTTYTYDRPGYYDYNGHYITKYGDLGVTKSMFPPRGMCRVWFPGRAPINQPPVESCSHIQTRVPAGAYVIYGG